MILLSFAAGLMCGGFLGMVVMSMLVASAEAREQTASTEEAFLNSGKGI